MMIYFNDRYISNQYIVYIRPFIEDRINSIKPLIKDRINSIELLYATTMYNELLIESFADKQDRDDRLRMLLTQLKSEVHEYPRD